MEYTDAPAAGSTDQHLATPTAATGALETAEGQASDLVAVMLSIVPGLGHIYKGYRLIGTHRFGFNAFFMANGVGEDLFPEVDPNTCLGDPYTEKRRRNWDAVASKPWQDVG